LRGAGTSSPVPFDEQGVSRQLKRPVTVDFRETPFEKVLCALHDLTGANLIVDERALVREGFARDTRITLRCSEAPLRTVLERILEQVNLDFLLRHESLLITSGGGYRDLPVRFYDVGDLVRPGAGEGKKAACTCAACRSLAPPRPIEELRDVIQAGIAPQSRNEAASGLALIDFLGNAFLIVSQTPLVHHRIRDFLTALRELQQ
jgi:hypothetical protein